MEKDICIEELKDMKKCLTSKFKSYMDGGLECVDTHEAYEIADIIKDLSESEKNCYEACYYKTVIEAMEKGAESDEVYGYSRGGRNRRMGYMPYFDGDIDIYGYSGNSSRSNGSDGRVNAPYNSGHSRNMGYKPYVDQEPYIQSYISDYGKPYDEWTTARKHYTETHSENDKEKMNESTAKHMDNVVMTIKEMWKEADPELRRAMKSELVSLTGTM